MLYQITSYIKFLVKSTNQHGVHSPFVYNLLTKCIYKKQTTPPALLAYRAALTSSTKTIEITDFGSGSRVFKSNTRNIPDIVKYAGIPKKRQTTLYKIAAYFNPSEILELGTSLGLATAALSEGNPQGSITSVEGCANTAAVAKEMSSKFQLNNIHIIRSSFEDFFASADFQKTFDLVYIDGNHSKEDTLAYFKTVLPKTNNNSVLIFDDIYWSKSMTEAWKEIIKHPEVTVSIDSFYWGLVFFRTTQEKQHFSLRL